MAEYGVLMEMVRFLLVLDSMAVGNKLMDPSRRFQLDMTTDFGVSMRLIKYILETESMGNGNVLKDL